MPIYVESLIHAPLDELWRLTQTPDLHVRWDLRFTDIQYLPHPDPAHPQQFLYATRIGLGLAIQGHGETVGQRDAPDGSRSSALKFWSADPKSLIHTGSGYWRYVPTPAGLRFLTLYDYQVRFGVLGRIGDALFFRPLLGWATAWSFDRLRLWLEKGIDPAVSMQRSLLHALARAVLAFVWLYQGLVPKLLQQHPDELAMLQQSGFSALHAPLALQIIGGCEVLFGLTILLLFHHRWPLTLTILLMLAATLGVALSSPHFLLAPFNPLTLNLLMIALASVGLLVSRDLPSARRCLRQPPRAEA